MARLTETTSATAAVRYRAVALQFKHSDYRRHRWTVSVNKQTRLLTIISPGSRLHAQNKETVPKQEKFTGKHHVKWEVFGLDNH